MKIPVVIVGLIFIACAMLPVGASGEDASLTAPKRGDSALPEKKKETPAPPTVVGGSGRRSIDDAVQIVGVKEGQPAADGRRKVTVNVQYALVSHPRGVLTLGFNLKSATHIVPMAHQQVMRGTEAVELSATIVPVKWPDNQPFKVYVTLTTDAKPKEKSLLAGVSQAMKPSAPLAAAP